MARRIGDHGDAPDGTEEEDGAPVNFVCERENKRDEEMRHDEVK
jgi:hypothetical protein